MATKIAEERSANMESQEAVADRRWHLGSRARRIYQARRGGELGKTTLLNQVRLGLRTDHWISQCGGQK